MTVNLNLTVQLIELVLVSFEYCEYISIITNYNPIVPILEPVSSNTCDPPFHINNLDCVTFLKLLIDIILFVNQYFEVTIIMNQYPKLRGIINLNHGELIVEGK